MALIWIELFADPQPFLLSVVLLIYSAITFAGVAMFGKRAWFRTADVFSVYFRLIGQLAPVEYRETRDGSWQVQPRRPFVGTLDERPEHISLVLFVIFMLSSTTYDGIHDTALWTALFWRTSLRLFEPLWGTDLGRAQEILMDWYQFYQQVGLLVLPLLYLGVYLLVLRWTKALSRTTVPTRSLALGYCYTLLPIALAYNFTHYFTFLIVQAQALPGLAVDPFGFGWNIPGLQLSSASPVLAMGVVWHTQVAVLLLGHLVSIYLAHRVTVRALPNERSVISQLPMLLLMVIYTILALWILSLPLGVQ